MPTRLRQVSGSGFDPTRRNGDHTSKVSIRTLLSRLHKGAVLQSSDRLFNCLEPKTSALVSQPQNRN